MLNKLIKGKPVDITPEKHKDISFGGSGGGADVIIQGNATDYSRYAYADHGDPIVYVKGTMADAIAKFKAGGTPVIEFRLDVANDMITKRASVFSESCSVSAVSGKMTVVFATATGRIQMTSQEDATKTPFMTCFLYEEQVIV